MNQRGIPEQAEFFMRRAIQEARTAADQGEVPVGAVIAFGNRLVAAAHNMVEKLRDPTAHAEMIAITQAAAALGDWRLEGTALYVTKEPCLMCAGAIVLARIPVVVWGVDDPSRGQGQSGSRVLQSEDLNHGCRIVRGILQEDCRNLLQHFFQQIRRKR